MTTSAVIVPDVPYTLTQILDHEDGAADRLLVQYRDKPRMVALIRARARRFQELETVFWQLLTERWISSATFATLDKVGANVGEQRQGRDDVTYRAAIRVRLLVNRSNGRRNEIIKIVRAALDDQSMIVRVEESPRGMVVFVPSAVSAALAPFLAQWLQEAKGGGVRIDTVTTLVGRSASPTSAFVWGSTTGVLGVTKWGTTTGSGVGGVWASVRALSES